MTPAIPDANKSFTGNEFYNRPIFETANFKVVVSLGALVEGWLLIIPKRHYISIGQINSSILLEELDHLINRITDLVVNEYGQYVLFEHGPNETKSQVGCGVDYAHIHIVPLDIDLIEAAKMFTQINLSWKQVADISFAQYYYKNNLPYLFVQASKYRSYIGTNNAIPSQLFRRVIAAHIGIEDKYNWRENFFLENIHKTLDRFSKYSIDICQNQTLNYE